MTDVASKSLTSEIHVPPVKRSTHAHAVGATVAAILASAPLAAQESTVWWPMRQATVVANMPDQELYRYGMHAPDFTVNVTVGPGTYYARLKFSENHFTEADRSAVSIYVNDEKRVDRMDVWATAAATPGFKQQVKGPTNPHASKLPYQRAVDVVLSGIQPKNGIVELRFVGEAVKGMSTEAILQALEVSLEAEKGAGDAGDTPVSAAL